jgi:hypothetical protein
MVYSSAQVIMNSRPFFLCGRGAVWAALFFSSLLVCPNLPAADASAKHKPAPQWWKGNLHTHSLWSDGDDYPEMITDWYKRNGYHFLALSDHNILQRGEKWIEVKDNEVSRGALEKYRARFADKVEEKTVDEKLMVRLKTFEEFAPYFAEPGRFLLLLSEEITDRHLVFPVHINATNLREFIRPQGGTNVSDVIQRNVNAVLEQRRQTGQPMFPHVNHPNFGWAITAEDLVPIKGEKFFEVYNGHPFVRNEGDHQHASTERMWDIILTRRLAELGLEPMFGLAVDDAHNYHSESPKNSNPGRGWVMVRAVELTPEAIIEAMEAGEFYASSGVTLTEVRRETNQLSIRIQPEKGVSYTTQFIGTRRGYDPSNQPVTDAAGNWLRVTHRYSEDIGTVLAEVSGTRPRYRLKGDEIYVRAKIISTKVKANPYMEGEVEVAWTQPLVPAAK